MNSTFYFNISAKIFIVPLATMALVVGKAQTIRAIDYLGQKPPGLVAEVFAPGIVSTKSFEHSAPAFSPDGRVVLWTVVDSKFRGSLLEMKYENDKWSTPASPSFADTTADDYYPSFSADGKKLFFSSRRKLPAGYPQGGDIRIWEVERTNNGWGNPVPFDTVISKGYEFAHSISNKGTLYFSFSPSGGINFNIKMSEKINGRNTEPILLPYSVNSVDYEDGPYIAPDESFLIFESQRAEGTDGYLSLYISFRDQKGQWGMPVNMGPKINSGKGERFARLSPDGKYLFFGSFRHSSAESRGADIYWIDAKIIDELRKNDEAKTNIRQPLGNELIQALVKSDTASSASLLKQWLSLYPNSMDATVIYSSVLRKQKRYSEVEQLMAKIPTRWSENAKIIMEKALIKFAVNQNNEAGKLLSPVLRDGSQLRGRYLYLSNSLFDMAKFKLSDEYFEKAMSIHSHGVFWYNRACGYSNIGRKDEAFDALNKAADLGYNERKNYEADPDLVPLKSDARWKLLMEKLK
jgi:WD40-like Beta Propeller Repeat